MTENIICLAIGNFDNKSITAELIPNTTLKPYIRKEIFALLSEKPAAEWLISTDSQFGLWSMIANNNVCYMFLGPKNYPSCIVNSLLFDIKTALKDTQQSEQEILESMSKKYQNGQGKIKNLSENIKKVQELAYVGIKKVMENTEIAEDLSEKTDELASTSFLMNQEAKRLERQMYWRKIKLKFIIGIAILSVLLYVVIPLFSNDN